jgi:hypothetical protein
MMIFLRRFSLVKCTGIGMMILAEILSPAFAQEAEQELPVIIAGKMPLYPLIANHLWIQGVVKIRVTTDGEKVTFLEAESGPPMLVKAAKENILTWEFMKHKPTTFVTTFEYVIEGPVQCMFSNGALVLNLPQEIRIRAKGIKTCDPAVEIKSHP